MVKAALTLFKGLAPSLDDMSGLRLVPWLSAALVAVGLAIPAREAQAQEAITAPCRLCDAESAAKPDSPPAAPLRIEVQSRLEFDKVVFGGVGDAMLALSPDGVARMAGATHATGARAMPGSVLIRGEPGRMVRIDLPAQVQLFGEGGSGSIRIDSLVTDLPAFPRIGDDGTLSFRFGGDLRISGDSDGAFRGSIDIIVEYL